MTAPTIQVHVPAVVDAPCAPLDLAPRGVLGGDLRLGLVDNGKPRARDLLLMLGEELARVLPITATELVSKPSAASPLGDDEAAALASRVDLAITGLGDCGACSACSLQDALLLERNGVPAAVLITDVFTGHVARFSSVLGAPGYAYLVVPHPVATKTDDHLRSLAAGQAGAAAELLGLGVAVG